MALLKKKRLEARCVGHAKNKILTDEEMPDLRFSFFRGAKTNRSIVHQVKREEIKLTVGFLTIRLRPLKKKELLNRDWERPACYMVITRPIHQYIQYILDILLYMFIYVYVYCKSI